jgi:two-component system, cell cycle sensor histidine kinase and response regulator CckA
MSIEYQKKPSVSSITLSGNLLLINDNPTQLDAMGLVLSLEGYSISTADCAQSALDMLERQSPDLIISDVVMPGMDGIELCRLIKSDAATAEIPVLLVSGLRYDDASVLKGLQAGADEYLEIDAPPSLLLNKVGRLIAQTRANQARLKAEIALGESERQYRLLFESNPQPMWVYDVETLRFLTVNEKAISHYGYSREEFLSLTVEDIRLSGAPPRLISHPSAQGADIQYTGVVRHKKKGGTVIEAEIFSNEILFQNRHARLVLANDITDRRRNEEAMRASEERFSKAFSASPVPMSIVTYERGMYIDVNESFLSNSGYTREEIIGRTTTEINLYADPRERTRLRQILEEQGRILNAEVRRRVKGGEVRVALASSEVIYLNGERCILTATNDITEHRRLEEQLLQSQKMESIGRLAGGVAHDFNNLLTAIIGYSQLLLRRLDKNDQSYLEIEEIMKSGQSAAALTSQLLAFSRKQVVQPQVFDLNAVVANIEKMLRRLIGEDVELVTMLEPQLANIKADPNHIEQILLNLAVNARDAMPEGGKLMIETANVYLDESYASQHISVEAGRYVMLAVSDTGIGMNKQTQSQIFEPFFTTKEKGKGTGLGLSTVYGIVKQSEGNIWVYSEPGHGTIFKVYLPQCDESIDLSYSDEALGKAAGGSETVLLVEDEEAVRKLTRKILEENGYRVLEATHAGEAVTISNRHEGAIHVMITDMVMPHTNGHNLAEQVGAMRPEMKLLYMSGYTENRVIDQILMNPAIAFLEKPFSVDGLLNKVRNVLAVD